MKTGEELHCKVYQSQGYRVLHLRRILSIVVRIHLTWMRENPTTMKAKSVSTGEPVAATSISESQAHHTPPLSRWTQIAKKRFKRLIEQFEKHPNRDVLLNDFEKGDEINHFSEESENLITDMGNTEIFGLFETSSKRQCPDCALYWEIGIEKRTCGEMHAAYGTESTVQQKQI